MNLRTVAGLIMIIIGAMLLVKTGVEMSAFWISVNPISVNIPNGVGSVTKSISPCIQLDSSDSFYAYLYNLVGPWDYYISPFKTIPGESATITVSSIGQLGSTLDTSTVTTNNVIVHFYGWYDNSSGPPTPQMFVGSAPVKITSLTNDITVKVNMTGVIKYAGTTSVHITITTYDPSKVITKGITTLWVSHTRYSRNWTMTHNDLKHNTTSVILNSETSQATEYVKNITVDKGDTITISTPTGNSTIQVESNEETIVAIDDFSDVTVKQVQNVVDVAKAVPSGQIDYLSAVVAIILLSVGAFLVGFKRGSVVPFKHI